MTNQVFTVAGTSKQKGEHKVRFANDTLRVKVLEKHDHTEVILFELPKAMTKLDAIKFIKDQPEFANAGSQSAIADYLDRKDSAPVAPVATKAPKAKKMSLATKQVDEDAPF